MLPLLLLHVQVPPCGAPRESASCPCPCLGDVTLTPPPLFVFVNFDLFAAYFALCATGTACCQCKLIWPKNDLHPLYMVYMVVFAAVCQPISFDSVFWQVNMRFSKYFRLFVCLLRTHTCMYIIFYTLQSKTASIKSSFSFHM